MTRLSALGILLSAAFLEAGGDALVRLGLRQESSALRSLTFLGGALVLFGYGLAVNAPGWDFGRLLGIYIAFFFVVAQIMSWLVFHQPPSPATIAGGALIVAGALVLGIANA